MFQLCPEKCRWPSTCICPDMQFLKKTLKSWHPPHCPNPNCKYHNAVSKKFPYKEDGFYFRKTDNRKIQRYLCLSCKRSFSTQTFSVTYWLKNPHLIKAIFLKTNGGMTNRQLARDLGVNQATIDRILARMARHGYLYHSKMLQIASPWEQIVVDGFVTFEFSQNFPFHHHLAVDKKSGFFIFFTDSEVRRSGVMTDQQKRKREELEKLLGRPDPQAVRKDMTELLQVTLKGQSSAIVYSDAHQSYPRAIRNTDCDICHVVTSSKDHRDSRNNLWEINLLDLTIRHYGSNHKRETIAWSKRRQSSANRLMLFSLFRNFNKPRREKNPRGPTPAMDCGLADRPLNVEDIFNKRIFRDHISLPNRWKDYYDGKIKTRALKTNRTHELKYAR